MDPIFSATKPLTGHRRSHSETLFRFEDDNVNATDLFNSLELDDFPSMNLLDRSEPPQQQPRHKPNHLRSLSVGSDDFFDGFELSVSAGENSESERSGGGGRPPPPRHRHSSSMDGSVNSSSLLFDAEMENLKKGMAPDRLAELALIDPKRAKRILANRQSAARSKERKIRYTGELERKVQTLQSEATNLSAQVTILQRDTTGLTAENKELKYKLQAMEQQAHLRDALSEALKEEVNRLKIAAGQIPAANGNLFNRDIPPQFSSRPPMFQNFNNSQNQQIHMSQSANNQTPSSEFSAQSYLHGLQPQG